MTKPQAVRKRAYAPKARTGCTTCKTRRIKCDEFKPQCHACTFRSLTCVYESRPQSRPPTQNYKPRYIPIVSSELLPLRSPPQSAIAALTSTEVRYLEYFHRKLAAQLSRPRLDSPGLIEFLSRTAPQQCEYGGQILDAILSIGALAYSRRSHASKAPFFHHSLSGALRNEHYCAAIKYHVRAVTGTRKALDGDPGTRYRVVLMTSALLILFEQLQDNTEAVDRLATSAIGFLQGPNPDTVLASGFRGTSSDLGMTEAVFFIYSNVIHNSIFSPMYPRGRQRLRDISFAPPSQMAVACPQKSAQEFITAWFRFTTNLLAWRLTSTPGSSNVTPLSIPQDTLSTSQKWEREARRRLSQNIDLEPHSTLIIKQILHFAGSLLGGSKRGKSRPTQNTDVPVPIDHQEAEEWLSMMENALNDPALILTGEGSDLIGDHPYITIITPLLFYARELRYHQTRLKTLELCRRLIGPSSPWNLKTVYLGTWAMVQVEGASQESPGQDAVDARYNWTEGHWNESYTELRVTLTEMASAAYGHEPRRKHVTVSPQAHGLV